MTRATTVALLDLSARLSAAWTALARVRATQALSDYELGCVDNAEAGIRMTLLELSNAVAGPPAGPVRVSEIKA